VTARGEDDDGPTSAEEPLDLSVEQVRALLAERYGLHPRRVHRVEGELATICRVEVTGRRLAAKVSRDTVDGRAALEWRTAVVQQLAAAGQPVPGIVPDSAGASVSRAVVDGTAVLVVVETWLDGLPLSAVDVDEETLLDVGTTAARLAGALGSVPLPPPGLTHAWEASRGRRSILAALPSVRDDGSRSLVARAADAFAAEVEPVLPVLPRAVVHQDLHDANLLVGPVGGRQRVVGVLDFGDMVHGLRVAELAVAAGYSARLTRDPLDGFRAVVAGWGRASSLEDVEVPAVLALARTRLAVNVAIWSARSAGTRSAYAAARSAGSLPALRALTAADPDALADEVRRLTAR
jgi:hydroxylysine kinase